MKLCLQVGSDPNPVSECLKMFILWIKERGKTNILGILKILEEQSSFSNNDKHLSGRLLLLYWWIDTIRIFLKYTRKTTILHILHNITYLCNIIIYYIFSGKHSLTIKSKISTYHKLTSLLYFFPFSYHYVKFSSFFTHLSISFPRGAHMYYKCWTTSNLVNFVSNN